MNIISFRIEHGAIKFFSILLTIEFSDGWNKSAYDTLRAVRKYILEAMVNYLYGNI